MDKFGDPLMFNHGQGSKEHVSDKLPSIFLDVKSQEKKRW